VGLINARISLFQEEHGYQPSAIMPHHHSFHCQLYHFLWHIKFPTQNHFSYLTPKRKKSLMPMLQVASLLLDEVIIAAAQAI
jgi:hypothetical protein